MSLRNLNEVFKAVKADCAAVNLNSTVSVPDAFRTSYSALIENQPSFSRHNRISWGQNGTAELWSRGNGTRIYLPSVAFHLAKTLLPLYDELVAYRVAVVSCLEKGGKTLDDIDENACVPYIEADNDYSQEEKTWLKRFVTDGSWWGRGRQIKRAQDFFESPLMQCAQLTQETQSEIARISKQFSEHKELLEFLSGTSNEDVVQPVQEQASIDRLTISLKLFQERRGTWRSKLDKMKGPTYRLVNTEVREYFSNSANWDIERIKGEEGLRDFCINHTWMICNGKGSWVAISKYSGAERTKLVEWIDKRIVKGEVALQNVIVDDNGLKGFTNKAASELLMKFHPESYILCNGPTVETLRFLRSEWDFDENYSYNEYLKILGAAATIRDRMADLGLKATIDGKEQPDFIAVNEFIFFVSENKDLIKERVMKEQLKPIEAAKSIKKGTRKLSDAFKDDTMLQRLAAALRTKPFAILAGHSGTGKSQLVRRLAYMTCNNKKLIQEGEGKTAPGNYCMVQVKPNWHDSTDLIGYYSDLGGRHFVNTTFVQFLCKAYAYPQTPFFLCLDEMNLAPVEQYFAEYLSAVESMDKKDGAWLTDSLVDIAKEGDGNIDKDILMQIMRGAPSVEAADWITKHGLTIPKNLFVVGTVNMDETTCQFSRKVLDRAMTLLMNEVKFVDMGKTVDPSKEELLDEDGINFFLDGARKGMVGTDEVALLDKVNEALRNTPFVIAYRFANEYALYEAALAKLRNVESVSSVAADAMDHVVLMKLLPRIHGERAMVNDIFKGKDGSIGLAAVVKDGGLSNTQMKDILERKDEYLTFWP